MIPNIILASRSPRRFELLKSLNLKFKVQPSSFEEHKKHIAPSKLVKLNAIGKAREIARKNPDSIIIGVDTIGAYKKHILNKPKDFADAIRILKMLNNTTHTVYSGVCVIDTRKNKEYSFIEKTRVTFIKMTDQEIKAYIHSGESMDKAAAFAAQGLGSLFIKKIDGDYFNVVGLPIYKLGRLLKKLGVNFF